MPQTSKQTNLPPCAPLRSSCRHATPAALLRVVRTCRTLSVIAPPTASPPRRTTAPHRHPTRTRRRVWCKLPASQRGHGTQRAGRSRPCGSDVCTGCHVALRPAAASMSTVPLAAETHSVEVNGVQLHARVRPGGAQAVLCMPGAMGTAETDFEHQATRGPHPTPPLPSPRPRPRARMPRPRRTGAPAARAGNKRTMRPLWRWAFS